MAGPGDPGTNTGSGYAREAGGLIAMARTEVAVVGAGPGGTITALALARHGVSVTIVEREEFPRFHIGESLTGGAAKLLRSLGLGPEMVDRKYPVKRGVSVWGPDGKSHFYVPVVDIADDGSRCKSSTWQVRRSDFDQMLLDAALDAGAQLIPGTASTPIIADDGGVVGLEISTKSGDLTLESDVLVDASGPSCFLARAGLTSEKLRGDYSKQVAIFTHVQNADRGPGEKADDTVILYKNPNHWAWFIPIDADTVSVGVVVPSSYFREKGESTEEFLSREFDELNPELAWRLAGVSLVREPQMASNYSYGIEQYVGHGWLCIGDAHQFVDPVFSFGLHLTVHEGHKAAAEIIAVLESGERSADMFMGFAEWATRGQEIIRDLVDAFWGEPFAFAYLTHVKHTQDLVDIFAGRVYDITEPSPGLQSMRKIAAGVRTRNQSTGS